MMRPFSACRFSVSAAGALALACLSWSAAPAQVPEQPDEPWRPAVLPPEFERGRPSELAPEAESPASLRPRLFRMPLDLPRTSPEEGPSPGRLQVRFGPDNPYFDLRRPGDPGGVGYRRLNTQLQVYDNGTTGLVVGVQAVRPSGLEYDGLNEGTTVVSPTLGLVRDLGDGAALQGFVGKDVRPGAQWSDGLERNLQYGMALQAPLPGLPRGPQQNVSFFVEALGRYRHETDASRSAPVAWEVLPGMHWRSGETWWMSGGVLVPVGPGRPDNGLLQFTCSWQF
jgi:hypothetical protein